MSLIGDALRKARKEAAQRESDRKGVLFSARISDSPTRSNLGLGLALGAVIAIIATVAGGSVAWWFLSRSEPVKTALSASPATGEASLATITTSSPALPDLPGEAVPTAATTSKASSESVRPDGEAGRPAAQLTAAVDPPPAEKSENNSIAGGFTGIEDGDEVYVMEAVLGKVRLSLDFIVFRPDDPFAEINGIELHTGGVVEGFRVKTIERDRVRLSDGRRSIVLRAP